MIFQSWGYDQSLTDGQVVAEEIQLGELADELGYHAVESPVHVNDLHATALHLLGVDHTRLTYRYQGRDFRLTDVRGKVLREILA